MRDDMILLADETQVIWVVPVDGTRTIPGRYPASKLAAGCRTSLDWLHETPARCRLVLFRRGER